MNGKPPGKADAGGDDSKKTEREATVLGDAAVTTEAAREQGSALLDTADEPGPLPDQAPGETVAEQLRELQLNEPVVEGADPEAGDGEESTAEEDDGDGEWISSFPPPIP